MNFRTLLQTTGRAWFIEEVSAYRFAEILQSVLSGETKIEAGLFTDSDLPYRANSLGLKSDTGEVMVIPVMGPMMKSDNCYSYGTATLSNLIAVANQQNSISAIVLHFDTPGGSVDGTEAFAAAIKASQKPIVAFCEMAASAGYWAASSCDEIVMSGETASAGSIGTMAKFQDTRGRDEANGVKEVIVFASRSTRKNKSSLDALTGKTSAFVDEHLDPLNAVFIGNVEANRGSKIDLKNEDVLTGKVYYGSNAVEVGLADKIGSLDYAIKRSLQLAKTIK
jgi:protease-4